MGSCKSSEDVIQLQEYKPLYSKEGYSNVVKSNKQKTFNKRIFNKNKSFLSSELQTIDLHQIVFAPEIKELRKCITRGIVKLQVPLVSNRE